MDCYPRANYVVSGIARNCGQKNHNLLRAIAREGGRSEVYVFCDSDVKPDRWWLRKLISPLADEDTPVATGFRWLAPSRGYLGELLHAMLNAYLITLIANRNFKGVWGGSMAIRREAFEKLGVAERWRETVVDDMSLSQLLVENRVDRVYVPSCLAVSHEAIPSVRGTIDWFVRQIAYIRYYLKSFWVVALIAHSLNLLIILSSPILLIVGAFYRPLLWGGLAGFSFTVLMMLNSLLIKSTGRGGWRSLPWFFFSPLVWSIGAFCLWRTTFLRSLVWRDTIYHMDKGGRVLSVVRKQKAS